MSTGSPLARSDSLGLLLAGSIVSNRCSFPTPNVPARAEKFPSSGILRQPIASAGRSHFLHRGLTCPELLPWTVDEAGISHLQFRRCVMLEDVIVTK